MGLRGQLCHSWAEGSPSLSAVNCVEQVSPQAGLVGKMLPASFAERATATPCEDGSGYSIAVFCARMTCPGRPAHKAFSAD